MLHIYIYIYTYAFRISEFNLIFKFCENFKKKKKTPRGLDIGTRVDSKYASRLWGAGFPRTFPRDWLTLLMGKELVVGSTLTWKDLKESTPSDSRGKINGHSLPRANLENELLLYSHNTTARIHIHIQIYAEHNQTKWRTSMNERTHFFIKIYLSHFILERVDVGCVWEVS